MFKAIQYIFSGKEKLFLLYIFLLVLVGSSLELLGVAVFSPFIEAMTATGGLSDGSSLSFLYDMLGFKNIEEFIVLIAAAIMLIYVIKNIFLTYEKNAVYKFSYGVQYRIAKRLIEAYLNESYIFHLSINPAYLMRTIQVDADNFAKAIIHLIELLMEIVVCFALAIYLFIVSPMITLVISVALLIGVGAYIHFSKKYLRSIGKKTQEYSGKVFQYMSQAFGGVKEIKVLGREKYFVEEFSDAFAENVRLLKISRLASILPKYFVEAICIVGLMSAVIIEASANRESMVSFLPQVAVFATAAFRLMPSVGRINEHMTAINTNLPSVLLIYKDLKSVENTDTNKYLDVNNRFELDNSVDLRNIVFGYPNAESDVLRGVSISIPKGKTIAFIGGSGSGKTTLVDIILGILQPKSGNVFVDGKDMFSNVRGWQKNIGYIPQAIYLSDSTIRENIAFGIEKSLIDDKAVEEAARKAQLLDFVDTLPERFDTVVGERGARISGGQKQRIGIARALYHNPEVLVLDEATSALDNETEKAVMEAIDGLHGEKTIIIIAHRLSTIQNADIVYEVNGGKVVEKNKQEVIKT